ncbi:hypothetical protein ACFQ2B_01105 [Streptomyces stramineus]
MVSRQDQGACEGCGDRGGVVGQVLRGPVGGQVEEVGQVALRRAEQAAQLGEGSSITGLSSCSASTVNRTVSPRRSASGEGS